MYCYESGMYLLKMKAHLKNPSKKKYKERRIEKRFTVNHVAEFEKQNSDSART